LQYFISHIYQMSHSAFADPPASKKQKEVQVYVWDFTLFVDTPEHWVEHTDIIHLLNDISKKWAFQLEVGHTQKKRHYQGRFSLNEKQRLNELRSQVPPRWHLSKTSNENKGNRFYVIKSDTREDGPWRDAPKYRQNLPYQWEGILENPRPFQKKLMDKIGERGDRKIDVIYDEHGCSGKSSFANRLEFEGKCYQLVASKNTNEMCADLCDELEASCDDAPGMIFVDMERASDQDNMASIFCALERIKGGVVKDRRYKLRKRFYASPPVVVFMNQLPIKSTLSSDRWRLWEMTADKDIVVITPERYSQLAATLEL